VSTIQCGPWSKATGIGVCVTVIPASKPLLKGALSVGKAAGNVLIQISLLLLV
jgi:hypothetical protein